MTLCVLPLPSDGIPLLLLQLLDPLQQVLRLDTQSGSHILDVDVQDQLILDMCHRLCNDRHGVRYALRCISPVLLREDSGIEAKAVLLMLADVLLDLLCRMGLREGVGILTLRQQHCMETHPALQPYVQSPHGRLDAGGIGVEDKGEIGRKALDLLHLLRREGGPGAGHHIGDPSLVHG